MERKYFDKLCATHQPIKIDASIGGLTIEFDNGEIVEINNSISYDCIETTYKSNFDKQKENVSMYNVLKDMHYWPPATILNLFR